MKNAVAVISGVIAGIIIIFIGDATTHRLYPMQGVSTGDPAAQQAFVASAPLYVMIVMLFFWLVAAFLGGMVAARLNRLGWKRASAVTGGILMAATLMNLILLPGHPAWVWLSAVIGLIPAALLGGVIVRPKVLATAGQ